MVVAGFATQTESRDEFCQESSKVSAHGYGRKCYRLQRQRAVMSFVWNDKLAPCHVDKYDPNGN
jgi:hypothetical protein